MGHKNESIVRRDVGTMHQKQVGMQFLELKSKENEEGTPLQNMSSLLRRFTFFIIKMCA